MIVITGTGRSGTSFTAKLFKFLGHDIGSGPLIFGRALADGTLIGGEDDATVRANQRLIHNPDIDISHLLRRIAGGRDAVKDPLFCFTLDKWVAAEAPIDYIVVCNRDIEASAKSALRTGLAMPGENLTATIKSFSERYNHLLEMIAICNLPYVEIEFPRSVRDIEYAYSTLNPFLKTNRSHFEFAWSASIDSNYVEKLIKDRGDTAPESGIAPEGKGSN